MGTPAYLAPERLEGKEADTRSDIFALGLILAEMTTGKRSKNSENLPLALDRVISRCVELDPDERWQSARDLKWELESIAQASPTSATHPRNTLIAGVLVAAVVLLGIIAFLFFQRQPASLPVTRVNILLPEKSLVRSLAVSPDGHFIAVVLVKDGKQQIWVRALDAQDLVPLPGTDNATDPFWSPDSRFIGFFADANTVTIVS